MVYGRAQSSTVRHFVFCRPTTVMSRHPASLSLQPTPSPAIQGQSDSTTAAVDGSHPAQLALPASRPSLEEAHSSRAPVGAAISLPDEGSIYTGERAVDAGTRGPACDSTSQSTAEPATTPLSRASPAPPPYTSSLLALHPSAAPLAPASAAVCVTQHASTPLPASSPDPRKISFAQKQGIARVVVRTSVPEPTPLRAERPAFAALISQPPATALEQFAKEMREEMRKVMASLNSQFAEVNSQFAGFNSQLAGFNSQLAEVKQEQQAFKAEVQSDLQVLRRYDYLTAVSLCESKNSLIPCWRPLTRSSLTDSARCHEPVERSPEPCQAEVGKGQGPVQLERPGYRHRQLVRVLLGTLL